MEKVKKMLRPADVENSYSVPVGTLANWRWSKRGPKFFKVNRKVLYRAEDLEEFFTANPVLTMDSVKVEKS